MELLERIKCITDSEFISDLTFECQISFCQFYELGEINIGDYSLKEWNDAAQYIGNDNTEFTNRLDAKKYICIALYKRKVA